MAIKISAEQAPKTPGGEPFDCLFVESIVLTRDLETQVWRAKVGFVIALRSQDGSYLPTQIRHTMTLPNFNTWAAERYAAGSLAAAQVDIAMQIALADAIAINHPQFSTAHYEA